jgi:hypothetical protein
MQQVVIYRIQAANLHKFNGISAFILPQSEHIYATNGRVVMPFCMSAFTYLLNPTVSIFPIWINIVMNLGSTPTTILLETTLQLDLHYHTNKPIHLIT